MVNVKNNARFLATDQRIEAAALQLMDRADGPQVNIAAICREAGINRSTFYEHFNGIDDMIDAMQEYLFGELRETFISRRTGHDPHDPGEMPLSNTSVRIFLEHIREHRYFYRISLKQGRNLPFDVGDADAELWKQIILPRCTEIGITEPEDMEYFRISLISGLSAILCRWVSHGCEESIESITTIIVNSVPVVFSPIVTGMGGQ